MVNGYSILINHETDTPEQQSNGNAQLFHRSFTPRTDTFDQYLFVWLDRIAQDESLDSLRTRNLLLELNNDHCVFFNDPLVFTTAYEQLKRTNPKILLIVSGRYARPVLSLGLSSVIIFCRDSRKYFHLFEQNKSVCAVCVNHESLKNCIQLAVPSLRFNLFENRSLQSFRPLKSKEDSISTGAYFAYISFIDILKQMPRTEQAKAIMVSQCLDYYRGQEADVKQINAFRASYTPEKAIEWYLKESFVFRLVNRAFRTEDVSLWYLFRFFIVDLSSQLERVHGEQRIAAKLTLYRGQGQLPVTEFDYLKSHLGGLIAMNGFFSTSGNLQIARSFILSSEATEDFQVALFSITVDAGNLRHSIFVDIDRWTDTAGENEFLFDIGSVFRIDEVAYSDEHRAWLIRLTATDENTAELKEQLQVNRTHLHRENLNILFGRLLIDMNYSFKAESYFHSLLQLLPKDHIDRPLVYDHLGDIHMRVSNWNEAFRNFALALQLKKELYRKSNDVFMAMSYNNLGNYYSAIEDFDTAYDYFAKALRCQIDLLRQAITKLNLGVILLRRNEYEEAFQRCFEAHLQLQEHYPTAHKEILHSYLILGNILFQQSRLIEAESFYITAFDLSKRYLVTGDSIQISIIQSLVELYRKQNQPEKATSFCSEQISLYSKNLFSDHPSLAHLWVLQGQVQESDTEEPLRSYEKALAIFEKHVHFQYASTARCLLLLGECYQRKEMFEQAVGYFKRANEIQRKIYPDEHPDLKKTEERISSLEEKY